MSKINNTQRAGLVRQLQEIKKKLEASGSSWYSYSKWNGYSGDDNSEIKAMVAALEDKHQLEFLKREEKRIERAIEVAVETIEASLKEFNDARETERQKKLKQLILAIRDIWAAETMEDAKRIVALFVE